MAGQARAGVAGKEVQPQRDSLAEGQTPIHPLRDQPARFPAGKAEFHVS
jgi:hypothetical protein